MSKSVKKGLFTHEHHRVTTGPREYANTVWVFTFLRQLYMAAKLIGQDSELTVKLLLRMRAKQ